ncbi:MAG TPA: hypothetical protein VF719_07675, partial [Abditibacteriaceae bacterium]
RANPYRYTLEVGGQESILPEKVHEIFAEREGISNARLHLYVGSVVVGCNFFAEDEMEFHIDPRDIKSKADAEGIFKFMRQIGDLLNKEVILTESCSSVEMARNEIMFKYLPGLKGVQHIGISR